MALAGARSKLGGIWNFDYRANLYDRARGAPGTLLMKPENVPNRIPLLNKLETKWAQLASPAQRPNGENVYGLIQADITQLNDLRQNDNTAAVSYLMQWLARIRVVTTYHILGWNGWRVSTMATNTNFNDPNLFAVAYQHDPDPTLAKGIFLYPWNDRGNANAIGEGRLEPGLVRARHDEVRIIDRRGVLRVPHPAKEVFMSGLPTAPPLFHLVLSPGNEAYLDPQSPKVLDPIPPPITTPAETGFGGDTPWVTNRLPDGAYAAGTNESWDWIQGESVPDAISTHAHQSAPAAGLHQHYFGGANETLQVGAGEILYVRILLDPLNPPREIMLQWDDGSWEHRAYWGENLYAVGVDGTQSRRYMGPLPSTGAWIKLEVPAKDVGLEGREISGMAFTLYSGAATWAEAGKAEGYLPSINVAAGKSATQSSTWSGIQASLAVDGNTSGNYFSHTNYDPQAWWQVDLGAVYQIPQINIWNRTDCCQSRLSNFYVFVSEAPFNSTDLNATLNQPGVIPYYFYGSAGTPTEMTIGQMGRYVRVQLADTNYLSLAEVEVFTFGDTSPSPPPSVVINDVTIAEGNSGSVSANFSVRLLAPSTNTVSVNFATANGSAIANSDYLPVNGTLTFNPGETSKIISVSVTGDTSIESNETFFVNLSSAINATIGDVQGLATITNDDTLPPPPTPNLALGKAATQSSTWFNLAASLAVDGNTNTGGNFSHTNYDAQAWWQVDLGGRYTIDQVRVWNRTDCCGERLSNFNIRVSDAPFDGTAPVYTTSFPGQAGTPSIITVGQTGRYVRVQLVGTNYLSLVEVEVYGSAAPPATQTSDVVWVEDSLPAGAIASADTDGWNWTNSGSYPPPFSGSLAHRSRLLTGVHQHFFTGASGASALPVNVGDKMFAYVFLDPMNPPAEVMLQWNDGSWWDHRAYWGTELTGFGGYRVGNLPTVGRWVRLEVPAWTVGLEGAKVQGMAFTLHGGMATWDYAGKSRQDTVWVDDALPVGAIPTAEGGDAWNWVSGTSPSPFLGTSAHQSNLVAGTHQHYFSNAVGSSALQLNVGDKLFAYVYLDPASPPREVMLQWLDSGGTLVRAYWGEDRIDAGVPGPLKINVGALPPVGRWVRLEVPASTLGFEGRTLSGMAFTLYDGRATWDAAGKVR